MGKLKNLFNTKQKKLTAIISVAVVSSIIFLSIIASVGNSYNLKTYESMVQAVCSQDYELAEEYIEALPKDYKDINNIIKFISIVQEFDENEKEDYASTIESLNEISEFNDERINDFYDSFNQKVLNLEKQYQDDKTSAELITNEIDSIADGDIFSIELSDEEAISKARTDYDNSSDSVKELITNESQLKNAEQRIVLLKEYKASADEVAEKINKIGNVTLDSEDSISDAYTAYENLSDEAKTYVTNIDNLTSAKEQLEELKEKKRQEEAKKATTKSAGNSGNNSYSGTVYWTTNGKVYHVSKNCPTLSRSKNIHSGSAPSGRRACKVCS